MRSMSCSWCHTLNPLNEGVATFCTNCEHRADVARIDCDCAKCRRAEAPRDEAGTTIAIGDAVQFVEPYQGFAGGTVAELLRGVMGPIAGVEIEPGRTVDTLCRRLRKV